MTVDEIIANLEEKAEKGIPMSPAWYLEQAQRLSVLSGSETDYLYQLQKEIAQTQVKWIEEGKSVAESKLRLQAEEIYQKMLKQKAKIERITEMIRISKLQGRMKSDEMFNSNL